MERATSYEALSNAIDQVFRGVERKESATGQRVLSHRDEFIRQCRERMTSGRFKIQGYHEYTIQERGKTRHIQCIKMEDRVCLNALMREVQRCLIREFIHDTGSSIEGRGGLWLHRRVLKALHENRRLRWFYKCDIRKCYESIPQDKMLALVERKFRESLVRQMIGECVTMLPSGMSIGLRASQELVNLYLSCYVDHPLKDKAGCKWYWRYCDDIVIGAENPQELTPYIKAVHEGVQTAGLEVKPSEQVFSIDDRPLDFLGYVTHGTGQVKIRKHIKQRFARRWKRTRSRTRRRELAGSFYGISKHAHSKNLFKAITTYNMKDFAELGISYVAEDGKKHWDCPTVQLNDLQNVTIVVKDYETGVATKNGERMLVLFDNEQGREGKFFTASQELRQLLDKIAAAGEIPFRTTIQRRRMADNKYKYCFT